MKKLIYSLIGVCVLATGCTDAANDAQRKDGYSQKPKSLEDSLFKLVINGHDVGMAKISKIRQAGNEIQTLIDELSKKTGNRKNDSLLAAAKQVKLQLDAADQGMNQWMETFNPDSMVGKEQERIAYLKDEQVKVEKVRDSILNSISGAEALLKAAGKKQ